MKPQKPLETDVRVIAGDWSHSLERLEMDSGLIISLFSPPFEPFANLLEVEILVISGGRLHSSLKKAILVRAEPFEEPESHALDQRKQLTEVGLLFKEFRTAFGSYMLHAGDLGAYRVVIDVLGRRNAKYCLLTAHDIAATHVYRPASKELKLLRLMGTVWSGLFSNQQESLVLILLKQMLEGESSSADLTLVTGISGTISLWRGRSEIDLQFSFEESLGNQVTQNVLIGPNGAGKTQILIGLAKQALAGELKFETKVATDGAHQPRFPKVVVFTHELRAWGSVKAEKRLLGAGQAPWKKFTEQIYRIATHPERDGRTELQLLFIVLSQFINVGDLHFITFEPRHFVVSKNLVSMTELFHRPQSDWARSFSSIDQSAAPVFVNGSGDEYLLSSGERSLAALCASIIEVCSGGALVLIDEPENHLHPKFISILLAMLSTVFTATQSRAVLVTHSPFVVREFERGAVRIVRRLPQEEGQIEILQPTLQTLGGDVSLISDHVFGDDEVRKGYESAIDAFMEKENLKGGSNSSGLDSLVRQLGNDGYAYLKSKRGID